MTKIARFIDDARKALVGAAGALSLLLADGTLTGAYAHYAKAALVFLTGIGIYATENVAYEQDEA